MLVTTCPLIYSGQEEDFLNFFLNCLIQKYDSYIIIFLDTQFQADLGWFEGKSSDQSCELRKVNKILNACISLDLICTFVIFRIKEADYKVEMSCDLVVPPAVTALYQGSEGKETAISEQSEPIPSLETSDDELLALRISALESIKIKEARAVKEEAVKTKPCSEGNKENLQNSGNLKCTNSKEEGVNKGDEKENVTESEVKEEEEIKVKEGNKVEKEKKDNEDKMDSDEHLDDDNEQQKEEIVSSIENFKTDSTLEPDFLPGDFPIIPGFLSAQFTPELCWKGKGPLPAILQVSFFMSTICNIYLCFRW